MNTPLFQHDNSSRSPLVREFATYIKGRYAAQVAGLCSKSKSANDINDYEEPIMVRSFFYRIMRTAFLRNDCATDPDSDFISATTAHQWASLDARDFRDLNHFDRLSCIHCAEIICANPSPFYRRAMQSVASDVLEIAHAAIRGDTPHRHSCPARDSDKQGELAIAPQQNAQRPALRLLSEQRSHRR